MFKPTSLVRDRGAAVNPFERYQKQHVECRQAMVARCVASLRRSRARFACITDLAKSVAEQVAILEGKPCSYTTLLRNERYRLPLLKFMTPRSEGDNTRIHLPQLRARVKALEIEVENVSRDNDRLRSYVATLENRPDEHRLPTREPPGNEDAALAVHKLASEKALLGKSLWLLMAHFKDLVILDTDKGCIIDLSAPRRRNVIIDAETARAFCDWFRANSNVLKNVSEKN